MNQNITKACLTPGILAWLFLSFLAPLSGQATFQKSYGDPAIQSEANDVIEIPGGFVVAGFTVLPATGRDGLLMRLDEQGNVVWENTYDFTDYDEFKAVATASDGGFVALGGAQTNIWVVKVAADGAWVWQKQFQRPNGGSSGIRIHAVPGGYILSGITGLNNQPNYPFAIRLDDNGNVLWSREYPTPNSLATVGYVTDSILYAGGVTNSNAAFMAIDLASGNVIESKEYIAPGTESLDFIHPTADGNLIMGNYAQLNWPSSQFFPLIQKVTPAGTPIWSKGYDFSSPMHFGGSVISTSDGGFLLSPGGNAYLLKTNEHGNVSWCHGLGSPNSKGSLYKVVQTSDGGFAAVGATQKNTGSGKRIVYMVKTNAQGTLNGCCVDDIPVTEVDFPVITQVVSTPISSFLSAIPGSATFSPRSPVVQSLACDIPQPTLQASISLCPGETVTLAAQVYAPPDTVILEIPSGTGCDTLATYILTVENPAQTSNIQLQCPGDIVKTIPAGTGYTTLAYPTPTAHSDCSCPGIDLSKTSGADSGSDFAPGVHTVCWLARDTCGSTADCCFNVRIEEEASACDIKTTSCLKWELLSVNRDAENILFYKLRVTNTCSAALRYLYVGIPAGITAAGPDNNSIYDAPSGRLYGVRNPNFSPVYGLRFKSQTGDLKGGQSDLFHFSLPPQIEPDYFYVAGRLDNSAFYEAHLNTFYCPVGTEPDAADRNTENAATVDNPSLLPNPVFAGDLLRLSGKRVQKGEVYLTDLSGKFSVEAQIVDNQVVLPSGDLPAGIYFFRIFDGGAFAGSGKMVVLK